MSRKLLALVSIWLMVVTTSVVVPRVAQAQEGPEYFLNPDTLPFEPLAGAANGWGEYRGAGCRFSRGPHVVALNLTDFSPVFDDGCIG